MQSPAADALRIDYGGEYWGTPGRGSDCSIASGRGKANAARCDATGSGNALAIELEGLARVPVVQVERQAPVLRLPGNTHPFLGFESAILDKEASPLLGTPPQASHACANWTGLTQPRREASDPFVVRERCLTSFV